LKKEIIKEVLEKGKDLRHKLPKDFKFPWEQQHHAAKPAAPKKAPGQLNQMGCGGLDMCPVGYY
jgi:hypothetical protein